jgi:hypothetical protein
LFSEFSLLGFNQKTSERVYYSRQRSWTAGWF